MSRDRRNNSQQVECRSTSTKVVSPGSMSSFSEYLTNRVSMVLSVSSSSSSLPSCISRTSSTSSSSSSCYHHAPSSDYSRYEVSHARTSPATKSQPLPLRSPFSNDSLCDEPFSSPLSSSAESISSIKSSCSSRSSAEREAERYEKRLLLDVSLGKIRSSSNLPLRKHLLVYNGIKQLQRDLDLLDDEDLYCTLMGERDTDSMEVDERRWLAPVAQAPAAVAAPAPPSAEERQAPASMADDDDSLVDCSSKLIMDSFMDDLSDSDSTWSWTGANNNGGGIGGGLFETIQDALDISSSSSGYSGWQWTGGWGASSSGSSDLWAPLGDLPDPLGGSSLSRFELQHLFPSQLLLQA